MHCLEYDTDTGCFALGIGHHVYVAHESRECQFLASHSTTFLCSAASGLGVSFKVPQPSEELTGDNPKPVRARGLHFHKKGTTSMLIVSYLHHGVMCVLCHHALLRLKLNDFQRMGCSAHDLFVEDLAPRCTVNVGGVAQFPL